MTNKFLSLKTSYPIVKQLLSPDMDEGELLRVTNGRNLPVVKVRCEKMVSCGRI